LRLPPSRLDAFTTRLNPLTSDSLSSSAAEPHAMAELLAMADPEARRLWDGLDLSYASSRGDPVLRDAIAELYEDVPAEGIRTFAGAQEGLFCALAALLLPGDRVVGVTPCYEALSMVPRMLCAELVEVPLERRGRWHLDADRLIEEIRPGTALVILNFPHNPTGADLPEADLLRILAAVESAGARLFSDEVFRLLPGGVAGPNRAAADLSDRAISLDVMAKSFGLAGVRVGWLACRDPEVLAAAEGARGWTSICNGRPDEVLALIGLRARDRILERNRAIVRENLSRVQAFVAGHPALLDWIPPAAGCTAFPSFSDGRDASACAERLAVESGVLLIPGSFFGSCPTHFRLGLGRRSLPFALALLGR
jgi:aspartate/methionine/tyrosine aminotransferase